ncbi:TonB-dependent receptor [Caenibius sp. WL]|uniref:TonB-dependent receptor n=1 Tax=Caenibius sp. WL TaxID=2872646 RepID=UPI001C99A930|nr:TonB-dependent receptor [Caenibius sp. WL]QZP07636.1 TonB-dependent receptor [Caenibius sp. WL]
MKSMKSMILAGSALYFAMFPALAAAQDRAGSEDKAETKSGGLGEIIVTAQKREERLLDVPIAITAIGAEQLEARGVTSAAGLGGLAPNLFYRSNPGTRSIPTIGIRGSITGQPAIWVDPPVGMYVDGVYLGKSQGSVFDIVDLERVEVLRGPQGTLFGRNTEGGAINFVTRKPSGEFKGKANLEFGEYNRRVFGATVDLPKMSIVSVTLAARKELQDGWVKNSTSDDLGKTNRLSLRAAARFELGERLTADYAFDYSKTRDTPNPTSLYALSGWSGNFLSVFGPAIGNAIQNALTPYVQTSRPKRISTNPDFPLFTNLTSKGHSVTLDFEATDNLQLKYIFSHRSMHYNDSGDLDGSPLTSVNVSPGFNWGLLTYFNRDTHYKQTSHELQAIGSALDNNLKYVVGLYHFKDDGTTRGAQLFSLFGTGPVRSEYASDTTAKAIYAQIDYTFLERLTATVGLRYTSERKGGWTHRFNTQGFDGPFSSEIFPYTEYSAKFHGTTPVAALSYKITDDINLYARVARGFKSGGFSSELSDPRVVNPYKPQKSLSMELGVKSRLFDNRATLNLTYFRNRITDQQLTQLLPASTQSFLSNAGKSIYQGIEIEAAAQIADGWSLQVGYGYLHTKFKKFLDNSFAPGRPLIDTASNRLAPYAPKHSLNINLDGELADTKYGRLHLITDYTYVSKTYLYPVNKSLTAPNAGGSYVAALDGLPSLPNLNMRLALSDIPIGPGKAELSLFVKNVTNEKKQVQGIDFGMYRSANWNEPRTITGTLSYKW